VCAVFDAERDGVSGLESWRSVGESIVPVVKGKEGVLVVEGCGCDMEASSTAAYAAPSATLSIYFGEPNQQDQGAGPPSLGNVRDGVATELAFVSTPTSSSAEHISPSITTRNHPGI
jgi:hypothetical protein